VKHKMTFIIILITIILYAILVGFTWHNLYAIEKEAKIKFVSIAVIVMLIITLIVFNIAKGSVEYPNEKMVSIIRIMLVLIFAPINGMIVMPFTANMMNKLKNKEITQEVLKKRLLILGIIFILILIFECSYLINIQEGIITIFKNAT